MFVGDPGPDSEACLPHYLPQRRGFLLGLGVADESPLWLPHKCLWQQLFFFPAHTHWILISNYNARGPIYTHVLRHGATVETDTNQLQPCNGEGDGREDGRTGRWEYKTMKWSDGGG